MGWNVPDDWGSYYYSCDYCGGRYHASEGGCCCLDDHEQCLGCQEGPRYRGFGGDRREWEGWHHVDQLEDIDGRNFCEEHLICGCCELPPARVVDNELRWQADADMLCCKRCWEEEHNCPRHDTVLDEIVKATNEAAE